MRPVTIIARDGPPGQEVDMLVEGLRARGVDVEYLLFADEGRDFVNPENLITTFSAAERFFAQHLGGRTDRGRPRPNRRLHR